jgi:hypothetical protein
MAGLLTGAMKGLSEAGQSYAGRVLDERMEARRAERLAGLKREERTYQEGREDKRYGRQKEQKAEDVKREAELYERRQGEEEQRYGRRQGEEETKYQRRLAEAKGKEAYTSPEGYMYEGGKPKMYQPSGEQAEAEITKGGLLEDAYLPGRQAEYEEALEPKHAKATTAAKKSDPAALKIADTIAKKFNVPWQEAWNISQRSKSDPREVSLELFRKRRSDVETNMVEESEEETWQFVRNAMAGAGFESKKKPLVKIPRPKTKEEIRDAYRKGDIKREEAIKQIKALEQK